MPGFVGLPEIIMLLVVALLIFGPKKLPEMGRSLGHGLREFKDSVSSMGSSDGDDVRASGTAATAPGTAATAPVPQLDAGAPTGSASAAPHAAAETSAGSREDART